jgi:hypothetical protein
MEATTFPRYWKPSAVDEGRVKDRLREDTRPLHVQTLHTEVPSPTGGVLKTAAS